MKSLIPAVALATFSASPGFTQTALGSEAMISLSVLDIIAIFFFIPLALLLADRFVRGRRSRADADASIRLEPRHDASGQTSDRYGQIISDLKRYALQPKWLTESRRQSKSGASAATETPSQRDLTVGSEDSSIAKSRSDSREEHRSGVGAS